MRYLPALLFAATIVTAQGCATSGGSSGAAKGAEAEVDADDPVWIERGDGLFVCNSMGLIRAVGKARIPNASLAKNSAAKKAKKNLEKVVGGWIAEMIRAYHKEKGTNLGVIEMTVKQMTDAAMRDAKISKSHREGNVTSVLAQLKLEDTINQWSQMNWGEKGEDPFDIASVPQAFVDANVPNVCRAD